MARNLETQDYLDAVEGTWSNAARIYFDLHWQGYAVRSPIDCCIAQLCLEADALLVHRDRDFETVAEIRPLRQRWF